MKVSGRYFLDSSSLQIFFRMKCNKMMHVVSDVPSVINVIMHGDNSVHFVVARGAAGVSDATFTYCRIYG